MQVHYTTTYKHLSLTERQLIGKWLKAGMSRRQIAKLLGRSPQTINKEVIRGQVKQMDTFRHNHSVYSYDYAQKQYERRRKKSTKKTKLDKKLTEIIVHYIKDKVSPEVIAKVKLKGSVSTSTLYNWLYQGRLGLNRTDMLYPHKTKVIKPVATNPRHYGKFIDKRPESTNQRLAYGHWEIDTVVLTRAKNPVLLTLTERKTRLEVIRLISDKTAQADNGSEFSRLSEALTCEVYYAHAYSSWERGTNENHNRMIRRFLPKGTRKTTANAVARIEMWMNNYPRKLFDYRSPNEMMKGG